jgi:hypothetical protein
VVHSMPCARLQALLGGLASPRQRLEAAAAPIQHSAASSVNTSMWGSAAGGGRSAVVSCLSLANQY